MKPVLSALLILLCSLSAVASTAASATGPTRAQVMTLFKYQCPIKIGQLLSPPLAATGDTSALVKDACTCVDERMALIPERVPHSALPALAVADMLACSRASVTEHHRTQIQSAYGASLAARGWQTAHIETLSQCMAQQHWRQVSQAGLQGEQLGLNLPALWKECAAQAGHASEPIPTQIK